jgi:hypothetical protein
MCPMAGPMPDESFRNLDDAGLGVRSSPAGTCGDRLMRIRSGGAISLALGPIVSQFRVATHSIPWDI